MHQAKEMIRVCAELGVHAVKVQNYRVDDFVENKEVTYTYTSQGKEVTETQWALFGRHQLNFTVLVSLQNYAHKHNIIRRLFK